MLFLFRSLDHQVSWDSYLLHVVKEKNYKLFIANFSRKLYY